MTRHRRPARMWWPTEAAYAALGGANGEGGVKVMRAHPVLHEPVDPPITGFNACRWHAVEWVWPDQARPPAGIAVCGWSVTVARYGRFDRGRWGRQACPRCVWTLAVHGGDTNHELARLRDPDLGPVGPWTARLAEAILAAARAPAAHFEPDHDYTIELLAVVSAHAPTALLAVECVEGDCAHDQDAGTAAGGCPVVGWACPACSPRTGLWAGEWAGELLAECRIDTPCEVLRTLATSFGVPAPAREDLS